MAHRAVGDPVEHPGEVHPTYRGLVVLSAIHVGAQMLSRWCSSTVRNNLITTIVACAIPVRRFWCHAGTASAVGSNLPRHEPVA